MTPLQRSIEATGLNPSAFKPWEHPAGGVFVCHHLLLPEKSFYFAMEAGRSYEEEHRPWTHTLTIIDGEGVVTVDGTPRPYKKGDTISIKAGGQYGFSTVRTDTIVRRGPSTVPDDPIDVLYARA